MTKNLRIQRWHLDKEGTPAMDVKHSHGKAMELPAVEVVFAPEIQVSSCVFFSSGEPWVSKTWRFSPGNPKVLEVLRFMRSPKAKRVPLDLQGISKL